MKPRRDAERVPPSFIDIWIGNIIVSGIEGVVFTPRTFWLQPFLKNCIYLFNNSRGYPADTCIRYTFNQKKIMDSPSWQVVPVEIHSYYAGYYSSYRDFMLGWRPSSWS